MAQALEPQGVCAYDTLPDGSGSAPKMDHLIEVERLTKRFGTITAVDDVTFSVPRGEVLGFLGPNGAGKSTTMRVVTGYLPPTGGTARVSGKDIQSHPVAAKREIGFLPEGAPLYGDMSVIGFLQFIARLRRLTGEVRKRRMADVIERMGLGEVLYQPIETLSKGYKRRVGMAQAILHDPDVLILDEPTDGLDPNQKHYVRELIREMGSEKAIIISTHILEEVDAVCSRALIIDRGRVVLDGTPDELHARSRHHNSVVLRVRANEMSRAIKILKKLPDVGNVETRDGIGGASLLVVPRNGKFIADAVGRAVGENSIEVLEMHTEAGKLDEVFRQITRGEESPTK